MTGLDTITSLFLSHPFLGMAILLVPWLPIMILAGKMKNPKIEKILHRVSIALVSIGGFLSLVYFGMINPMLIGAGYVIKIDALCTNETSAFAIDRLRVPDSEGQGSDTYRLHGFSLDAHRPTFRRLSRKPITLIGTRTNTVWIAQQERDEENRWEGISAETGAILFVVDAKTLKQKRPELAIGVQRITMDSQRFLVTVLAKDGRTWNYDPEKLEEKDPNRAGPPDDWHVCKSNENSSSGPLRLNNDIRAALLSNGRTILPDHSFLHGTVLAADPTSNITLIRSYTSTDEDTVILSAVSTTKQPALAWEKQEDALADQSVLARRDGLLSHALIQEGAAIIFIGNSVVGLDVATGAELWRTRW